MLRMSFCELAVNINKNIIFSTRRWKIEKQQNSKLRYIFTHFKMIERKKIKSKYLNFSNSWCDAHMHLQNESWISSNSQKALKLNFDIGHISMTTV